MGLGMLLPLLLGIGGSAIGNLFGGGGGNNQQSGNNALNPQALNPIWPWMQAPFGDWLFSGFTQKPDGGWDLTGAPSYPGTLHPSTAETRLPEAWNAWQPMDAGTMHLANFLYGPNSPIGKLDPRLQQMEQWGGTGGPGHQATSLQMQYGTPSQAGQYLANMAQFGMSSPGAGGPLAKLAGGELPKNAQYLLPFLTAQPYQAPGIPGRQVTRTNR